MFIFFFVSERFSSDPMTCRSNDQIPIFVGTNTRVVFTQQHQGFLLCITALAAQQSSLAPLPKTFGASRVFYYFLCHWTLRQQDKWLGSSTSKVALHFRGIRNYAVTVPLFSDFFLFIFGVTIYDSRAMCPSIIHLPCLTFILFVFVTSFCDSSIRVC